MSRVIAVGMSAFLATAGGSGGWYRPPPLSRWADVRYPMCVKIHSGRIDSGISCGSFGVQGTQGLNVVVHSVGLKCGPLGGPTIGVEYNFLGITPAGDRYRLVRTYPVEASNPEVTSAVVVFSGGRQVVFEAADHVVTVEPQDFRP